MTADSRTVLSSDEYSSSLTAIVQRDFFPGAADAATTASATQVSDFASLSDFHNRVTRSSHARFARPNNNDEEAVRKEDTLARHPLLPPIVRQEDNPKKAAAAKNTRTSALIDLKGVAALHQQPSATTVSAVRVRSPRINAAATRLLQRRPKRSPRSDDDSVTAVSVLTDLDDDTTINLELERKRAALRRQREYATLVTDNMPPPPARVLVRRSVGKTHEGNDVSSVASRHSTTSSLQSGSVVAGKLVRRRRKKKKRKLDMRAAGSLGEALRAAGRKARRERQQQQQIV